MNFFSSPQDREATLKVTRIIAFLAFLDSIIKYNDKNICIKAALLILVVVLAGNEILRDAVLFKNKTLLYYLSYLSSNIILGYLTYKIYGIGTEVYNILLLIEVILHFEKVPMILILINFMIYYISRTANIGIFSFSNVENIGPSYCFGLIIVYFFRSIIIEKGKTEKLNEELENVNHRLKLYAEELEQLTVAKERTRIAQELHDSIGHSLTALSMNLEFAESAVSKNPQKAKEVILKAHHMTKDCMVNLRKAVSVLKDTSPLEELRKAINEIFNNFNGADKVRFILNMDDEAENLNIQIKDCIYKTVREAITNGIKHGHATCFTIDIIKKADVVKLHINNNGMECDTITKSNGVIGIENRIYALSGTVDFYSENGKGFTVDANIPLPQIYN